MVLEPLSSLLKMFVRVYFWTLNFIPLICISALRLESYCFDCFSFVISFEFRMAESFCLSFPILFQLFCLLAVLCGLENWLAHFSKNVLWNFHREWIEYVDYFGEYCHSNKIKNSDQWTLMSFHKGLNFFSAVSCSFQCTSLSLLFFGYYCKVKFFPVSYFKCSLLLYRKKGNSWGNVISCNFAEFISTRYSVCPYVCFCCVCGL